MSLGQMFLDRSTLRQEIDDCFSSTSVLDERSLVKIK